MGQAGVRAKFAHARRHLETLTELVGDYIGSDHVTFEPVEDDATGDLLFRVRYRVAPPHVEWSLLAGDVIHNARSALDHLAWALVVNDGGEPTIRTQFPITDSEDKARKAINGDNLRGVSRATRETVHMLQPWHGGDDKLWRLHKLDILDKHRLLLQAGIANRGVWTSFPGLPARHPVTGMKIAFPVLEILPTDVQFPLNEGDVVFVVQNAARQSTANDSVWIESFRGVTLDVCLADGEIIQAESLGPFLLDLVTHAESSAEPLLALLPQ